MRKLFIGFRNVMTVAFILIHPALPQIHADEFSVASVIAEGASLQLLHNGFKFTEGPVSDSSGNVYFTDQPNDAIHCWTTENKLKTFLQPAGRSNGLFFDLNGDLLACADENNELWAIDPSGRHRILVNEFNGKRLNGPNDLWVDRDGAIYFTDPFYKRPYWNRGEIEQPSQAVYRVSPDRSNIEVVVNDLQKPNGIIGDREQRLLYVADIGAGRTYRFRISQKGLLTDKSLFCESGSDGMTIDQDGNLYLTGREGVKRYSRDGAPRETIHVPKPWTANVTFGGPRRDILFITAGDSLFAIQTNVKGQIP